MGGEKVQSVHYLGEMLAKKFAPENVFSYVSRLMNAFIWLRGKENVEFQTIGPIQGAFYVQSRECSLEL